MFVHKGQYMQVLSFAAQYLHKVLLLLSRPDYDCLKIRSIHFSYIS